MATKAAAKSSKARTVETLTHDEAKRKNIPTAEYQSVLQKEEQAPRKLRYPRNTDLDPQLIWRGKDEQDWSDLVVHAPPLYIQEKVHPRVLIDDLLRETKERAHEMEPYTPDLFADFNGIPNDVDKCFFGTLTEQAAESGQRRYPADSPSNQRQPATLLCRPSR
jgi:adenine-specific DNA-methyltransferase